MEDEYYDFGWNDTTYLQVESQSIHEERKMPSGNYKLDFACPLSPDLEKSLETAYSHFLTTVNT